MHITQRLIFTWYTTSALIRQTREQYWISRCHDLISCHLDGEQLSRADIADYLLNREREKLYPEPNSAFAAIKDVLVLVEEDRETRLGSVAKWVFRNNRELFLTSRGVVAVLRKQAKSVSSEGKRLRLSCRTKQELRMSDVHMHNYPRAFDPKWLRRKVMPVLIELFERSGLLISVRMDQKWMEYKEDVDLYRKRRMYSKKSGRENVKTCD